MPSLWLTVILLKLFLPRPCSQIGQNWWLSCGRTRPLRRRPPGERCPHLYLSVYFVLGVASLGSQFGSGLFLLHGSVNAARELYDGLINKVRLSLAAA